MSRASESDSSGSPSHSLIATAAWRARKGIERPRPLFQSRVPAGFPSPADDHVEASLDLSRELVGKEEATFFVRVAGDSMTDAGIHDGDILVVDRSVELTGGSIVTQGLGRRAHRKAVRDAIGVSVSDARGGRAGPIPIQDGQELAAQGVVQHVIHEVS